MGHLKEETANGTRWGSVGVTRCIGLERGTLCKGVWRGCVHRLYAEISQFTIYILKFTFRKFMSRMGTSSFGSIALYIRKRLHLPGSQHSTVSSSYVAWGQVSQEVQISKAQTSCGFLYPSTRRVQCFPHCGYSEWQYSRSPFS